MWNYENYVPSYAPSPIRVSGSQSMQSKWPPYHRRHRRSGGSFGQRDLAYSRGSDSVVKCYSKGNRLAYLSKIHVKCASPAQRAHDVVRLIPYPPVLRQAALAEPVTARQGCRVQYRRQTYPAAADNRRRLLVQTRSRLEYASNIRGFDLQVTTGTAHFLCDLYRCLKLHVFFNNPWFYKMRHVK